MAAATPRTTSKNQPSAKKAPQIDDGTGGRGRTVGELMTRNVVTVRPDTSVEMIVALMLDRQISGLPVVDESGAPVGVVSKTDVVRDQFDRGDTEEDEAPAVTVPESADVLVAAKMMAGGGIHRMPVVNDAGKVVGIVSSMDILGWLAGMD